MNRVVATFLILALLFGGIEYATDYVEAFEGTPLAVLADGHAPDDGHTPAEHAIPCDGCHCGGVHLAAMLLPASAALPSAPLAIAPWHTPVLAAVAAAPILRPPIA